MQGCDPFGLGGAASEHAAGLAAAKYAPPQPASGRRPPRAHPHDGSPVGVASVVCNPRSGAVVLRVASAWRGRRVASAWRGRTVKWLGAGAARDGHYCECTTTLTATAAGWRGRPLARDQTGKNAHIEADVVANLGVRGEGREGWRHLAIVAVPRATVRRGPIHPVHTLERRPGPSPAPRGRWLPRCTWASCPRPAGPGRCRPAARGVASRARERRTGSGRQRGGRRTPRLGCDRWKPPPVRPTGSASPVRPPAAPGPLPQSAKEKGASPDSRACRRCQCTRCRPQSC